MKTCFKCGVEKSITEFYRHPMMGDGRLGKCKECTKQDVSKNYRANIDHYKQYERGRSMLDHRVKARKKYVKTPAGKRSVANAHKRQRELYPLKYAARNAVNNALRDGLLSKGSCEICGSTKKTEAHHQDYLKPLEVQWLCQKHHRDAHKE